jgi:hypothetical protein
MKVKLIVSLLFVAIVFTNCASVKFPVSEHKSFPSDGKYEILGTVFFEDNIIIILGLIWLGGATYSDLLSEATTKYNNRADDVVNITVDEEIECFLGMVIFKMIRLRGIAIRYM